MMGVGLDPELTKWSVHSGSATVLARKEYKGHHWLVVPHQPLWLSPSSPTLHMPSDHHASSSHIIPGSVNHLGIGPATVHVCGQARSYTNQGCAITPFMFNEEEYRVSPSLHCYMCSDVLQYACNEDGVEYPSAHDFYHCSNTHDPDQDRFHDLYHQDFIHALSQVARHKLSYHQLDPYQCATFQCSIICRNVGEEEADPILEMAMEYARALGTIMFNESCHLHDLTEAQVGRNQFAMDIAVDWLDERIDKVDGRVDHVSE